MKIESCGLSEYESSVIETVLKGNKDFLQSVLQTAALGFEKALEHHDETVSPDDVLKMIDSYLFLSICVAQTTKPEVAIKMLECLLRDPSSKSVVLSNNTLWVGCLKSI